MPELPKVPAYAIVAVVFFVLGVFLMPPDDRFGYFMGLGAAFAIWLVALLEDLQA